MTTNLVSFVSWRSNNMNRTSGKLRLLLQCLLLAGCLLRQSWAQHQRPPFNIEDFGDYEEDDRFDNHHPLDPYSNYPYRGASRDDEYLPVERDPYDEREEYPEPRIIAPPPDSREQNPESVPSYDRNTYSREENPEPRLITQHVSTSHDGSMYPREEISEQRHISPHVSISRDGNMYTRDENLEAPANAPHVSNSRDGNMYSREEKPEERVITPHVSTTHNGNMYSREEIPEQNIITPHVSSSHDGNMYSREENPEPHIILPPVRPYQARNERPVYPQTTTPAPPTYEESQHEYPTYQQPAPSSAVYPYQTREERPVEPQTTTQNPRIYEESPREYPTYHQPPPPQTNVQPSVESEVYSHQPREERPIEQEYPTYQQPPAPPPTNIQPSAERGSYPHVPRPVDPRTITPAPSRTYEESQRAYPTYQQPPSPRRETHVISVPRLGPVQGYREFKIIKNRPISAYLGLKYGTVRPGIGRFQAASPIELDTYSTIDATKEPANCPQFPDLAIISEKEARGENVDDCLTLNIYAPARSGSYPVMVFIHGEMLFDGGAEEGQPDYFLEHDVVLVTVNYRLAPFGYLSTLTDDMPGNVALSDVQMSLEWIQQYIRYFNGNPDQVTLLGQAGGSTLIHALSLSGKAQGLFHKLILQSGTALNPYFLDEQPISTLRSFAHYARCPPSRNIEGFSACFESLKTSELLNYFKRFFESNEPRGLVFTSAFKLIVGDRLGYLPQHPASMVANNTYPTVVGVTKDAGAFIMTRFYDQLVDLRSRNISDYINVVLKHTTQPRHYQLWKNWALTHIFTPDDVRNPTIQGLVQKLLELVNLILYRAPVLDSIRYTSKNISTYLYCFDYRGEYHRFGHLRNPLPFEIDATLSDDNIFLFPYPVEVSHLNPMDKSVSNSIVRMWVSFAQYGMPVYSQIIWPNVTSEYGPFLRFTNTRAGNLELDYHFGDGIPVPNIYPEYFTTTTTSTTSTTTTTTSTTTPRPYQPYNYQQRPNYPQYPNYQQYSNRYNPRTSNYHDQEQYQPQSRSHPGQMRLASRHSYNPMRHQQRRLHNQ